MPIYFDDKNQLFKLDTSNSTYIIQIFREGYLLHPYYGAYIPDNNVKDLCYRGLFSSFSPQNPNILDEPFTPDLAPMEYSCNGTGDYRISALQIKKGN